MQIEVETVDRTGTFLGTVWESRINVAIPLLEAGLAKLQTSFGLDRVPEAHLLVQAEQLAKQKKLKVNIQFLHDSSFWCSFANSFYCRYGRIMLRERKLPMVHLSKEDKKRSLRYEFHACALTDSYLKRQSWITICFFSGYGYGSLGRW